MSIQHKSFLAITGALFSCLATTLPAVTKAAETEQNSLWLDLSRDSESTRDASVSASLAISKQNDFLFKYGNTRIYDGQEYIDVYDVMAGVRHRFSKYFDLTLRYEAWGKSNDLETDKYEAELGFNTANWSFQLIPAYREISLYRNTLKGVTVPVDLNSTSLGVAAQYYGIRNWELSASAYAYDYSKNVSALRFRTLANIFTSNAVSLASGFQDHSASAGATYLFPRSSLGVKYEDSVSAIDNTHTRVTSVRADLLQWKPFMFNVEAGSIDSDTAGSASSYFAMGFGYRW